MTSPHLPLWRHEYISSVWRFSFNHDQVISILNFTVNDLCHDSIGNKLFGFVFSRSDEPIVIGVCGMRSADQDHRIVSEPIVSGSFLESGPAPGQAGYACRYGAGSWLAAAGGHRRTALSRVHSVPVHGKVRQQRLCAQFRARRPSGAMHPVPMGLQIVLMRGLITAPWQWAQKQNGAVFMCHPPVHWQRPIWSHVWTECHRTGLRGLQDPWHTEISERWNEKN